MESFPFSEDMTGKEKVERTCGHFRRCFQEKEKEVVRDFLCPQCRVKTN